MQTLSSHGITAAVLATILFSIYLRPFEITDADVFWHLASGRWILQNGRIPFSDPFSHTAVRPWVDHEWLFQVGLRMLQNAGGITLMYMVKVVLYTAAIALPTLTSFRKQIAPWSAVTAALLAVACSLPFSEYRPLMVSMLFLALTVTVMSTGQRARWTLPPLFALWANMHATFLLGLAVVAVYAAVEFFEKPQCRWNSFILALLCLATTLVNPYGYHVLAVPFAVVGSRVFMTANQEWRPPDFSAEFTPFYFTGAVLLVAAAVLTRRKLLLPEVILAVLFALLCMRSRRIIPYFAVVSVLPVAAGLNLFSSQLRKMLPLAFTALLMLLCAWAAVINHRNDLVVDVIDGLPARQSQFPYQCARTLHELAADQPRRLFNDYNHGGFLDYAVAPKWKVYIDGRNDLFGEHHTIRYNMIALARGEWQRQLDEAQINAVLVSHVMIERPRNIGIELSLDEENWILTDFDDAAVLFLRRNAFSEQLVMEREYRWIKPALLGAPDNYTLEMRKSQLIPELEKRHAAGRCRIAEMMLAVEYARIGDRARAFAVYEELTEFFGAEKETEAFARELNSLLLQLP